MPMDLYHKALDEAATIPLIDHITLTGLGEPLLDRFLDERVAYARAKKPGAMIDLYTGGGLLTLDRALKLYELGVNVIYVSLNAVNADMRWQVMRLKDYDKVAKNCHLIIDELAHQNSPNRLIVKAVMSKDLMDLGDLDLFWKEWNGDWRNGGHAFVTYEGNWASGGMRTVQTKACGRALNEIMLLSDGRFSLCCFDSNPQVVMGDLNTQTIREVYSSEKYVAYRTAHAEGRRNELALCSGCTGI